MGFIMEVLKGFSREVAFILAKIIMFIVVTFFVVSGLVMSTYVLTPASERKPMTQEEIDSFTEWQQEERAEWARILGGGGDHE